MNLAHLNPFVRYAAMHSVRMHGSKYVAVCYDCRIVFSVNATGMLQIGNEKYNISNNTVVFLPAGTHYRFFFDKEKDSKTIFINADITSEYSHLEKSLGTAVEERFEPEKVLKNDAFPELSYPIIKSIPEIYPPLFKIAENFLNKPQFYREESSALLKICLIELIKRTKENKYSHLCEEVMDYIKENYQNPVFTNEEIAEKFSYHPYHLSKIMKEETGKSLHKCLMDYRLRAAKNLLSTTDISIEDVAIKTGFSQTSYFVKCFREKTGMTPRKYRSVKSVGM